MEAEAAGAGGLGEPGEGAAAVRAPDAPARVPAASAQYAQWVTGRGATFLGARQLPGTGYGHGRGTGPRLEHVQRVALGRVLGAARVAPWPRGVEAQQRDLVPARQELREGRRVGARLEGALGAAQAHQVVMLRRQVDIVAVLQSPLAEPAVLRAEMMLEGKGSTKG